MFSAHGWGRWSRPIGGPATTHYTTRRRLQSYLTLSREALSRLLAVGIRAEIYVVVVGCKQDQNKRDKASAYDERDVYHTNSISDSI